MHLGVGRRRCDTSGTELQLATRLKVVINDVVYVDKGSEASQSLSKLSSDPASIRAYDLGTARCVAYDNMIEGGLSVITVLLLV